MVTRVFKGQVGTKVRITSYGTCDLGLVAPGSALVFARRDPRRDDALVLASSYCQGTRPLDEAPVPASFGAGVAPGDVATEPPTPPAGPARLGTRGPAWWVVGAVTTAALLGLGLGARRRWRGRAA